MPSAIARRRDPVLGCGSVPLDHSFLAEPPSSPDVERMYADELAASGYVDNLTYVWAHVPSAQDTLVAVMRQAAEAGGLTLRQRVLLVSATASAFGDSEAGAELAGGVLRGDDGLLDPAERALAAWARSVARNPNGTTADDVQRMRDAGFDDRQIFAITLYVASRIAFSTVNDALGARPDHQLITAAPDPVRAAVTYGRPAALEPAGDQDPAPSGP
jgi:hypothetical protein